MAILNLHTTTDITLVCTKVNRNTKQAERIIRAYEKAKYDDILKAYGRPSSRKISSFNEIKNEMVRVKGFNMRITGAGSDVYSCAYQVKDGSDITYIIYHTPSNRFCVEYKVPEWIEANRR